jgi:hypothetical protein
MNSTEWRVNIRLNSTPAPQRKTEIGKTPLPMFAGWGGGRGGTPIAPHKNFAAVETKKRLCGYVSGRGGSRLEQPPDICERSFPLAPLPVPFDRSCDCVEHVLVTEWLRQEIEDLEKDGR